MVEWDMKTSPYHPFSYFLLLKREHTFYHEIGHHVNNHTFGQDPDQEIEANSYAAKLLRKGFLYFVL